MFAPLLIIMVNNSLYLLSKNKQWEANSVKTIYFLHYICILGFKVSISTILNQYEMILPSIYYLIAELHNTFQGQEL